MRTTAYAQGVRRKKSGLKKLALVTFLLLVSAGASAVFIPKTNAYNTAKQLYQATFGGNHKAEEIEMDKSGEAISVEAIEDSQKPSVQVSSPLSRQVLSGDVSVEAQASDNIKIAKVEFYIDGSLVGTDELEPYAYNWATSGEVNGRHTLLAKAYDVAGNNSQAQVAYNTVNKPKDGTPPTVNISAPGNGSLVKGVTELRATAYDASGISKVEFYLGTALIGSDDKSPYMVEWDANKSRGVQKITARAYDSTGNVNTSGITTVIIDAGPADNVKPTVVLSTLGKSSLVADTVELSAEATDDQGLAKVEFFRGDTLLFTDTKAPYSYAWDSLSVENGAYKFTAKAFDTSGNVQNSRAVMLTVNNSKERKPAASFDVPSQDNASLKSKVSLYGACAEKLSGKPTATPVSLAHMQVMVGFEFTSNCLAGGKHATVSVDLGREVTNRGALKVLKLRADGTVADITMSSTIDTRKSNGASHTFVTYSVVDGGDNDQDGAINGTLVDPVFVAEEVVLKDIEQPAEKKPEAVKPAPQVNQQPESISLADAINAREYLPYGAGVFVLGIVAFLFRPRRSYKLNR